MEINYSLTTVVKDKTGSQDKLTGDIHVCGQCGHEWISRPWRFKPHKDQPFKCPHCGSRYWWVNRLRPKVAKVFIDPRISPEDIEALNGVLGFGRSG